MVKWTAKQVILSVEGALHPTDKNGNPLPPNYKDCIHVLQSAWDSPEKSEEKKVRRNVLRNLNRYQLQARYAFELNGDELKIHELSSMLPEARAHCEFELKRRYRDEKLIDARKTVTCDRVKDKDGKALSTTYRPSREYVGRLHGGRTSGAWEDDRMLTGSEGSYVRGTTVRSDGTMRHVGHGFTDLNVQESQAAYNDVDANAAKKARRLAYAHRRGNIAEIVELHRG